MDERADGRRTFHSIWQPHVQRQLCRLGSTGEEEQQADYRDRSVVMCSRSQRSEDACQVTCSRVGKIIQYTNAISLVGADKNKEDSEHQAKITDDVDDKRLLAAATAARRWYQKPISRYDARATSAQPTSKKRKLSALTSSTIAKIKKFI